MTKKIGMRGPAVAGMVLTTCLSLFGNPGLAERVLVQDGQPRADIVIAGQPPRAVKVAAEELRTFIEKISGANLAIVTSPGPDLPVHIYVGRSPYTDKLNLTDEGLKYGAFRMVSGDNFLALLGHDSDFTPPEPYLRNWSDMPRLLAEWDKATGDTWEFPYTQIWKEFSGPVGLWEKDERGSLNAVYRFLYEQGVRWYLPGKLGEIVPKKATIKLPAVDETVTPDFPVRYPYIYGRKFGGGDREDTLWQLRMGFNQAPDVIGVGYIAHGTAMVLARDEMKAAHPEYYALIGGKRRNGDDFVPCLSSEGLFQENLKLVRTIFDIYDAPMVSVMPTDGFTASCQCDGCRNQPTPERGWLGQYSDYVWSYVDRVAREVYKTHPDRKVVAMAYGSYFLPPTNITTFSPNIVVCMAQGRGRISQTVLDARKAYLAKLPAGSRQFMVYEYYLHARPSNPHPYLPAFYPHAVAEDLHALKPYSLGDYVEVYRGKGIDGFAAAGLNLYVTAQYWWNADQNVDALLDAYYTDFYGPARNEMKDFIEYCETNWPDMAKSADKVSRTFELMEKARAKAPADSIYAQRIALVADFIAPMETLREELSQGRGKVPQALAVERSLKDLDVDGALDDTFWDGANVYDLKDLKTGQDPTNRSSFQVAWANDTLCFAVTCLENDMPHLNIAATKNEDSSIWAGDCIEIELETPTHSYYQIAISPSGAVMDLDRKDGFNSQWCADAKVAAGRTDGAWTLEVSLPIADEMQGALAPLHGVAGSKPSADSPWFFNVCRQRMRGTDEEYSAFSPPMGGGGFHVVRKFGKLIVK